jgi:hypothetical protein
MAGLYIGLPSGITRAPDLTASICFNIEIHRLIKRMAVLPVLQLLVSMAMYSRP